MILRLLFSLIISLALASPSWARIVLGTAGALATGTTSITAAFPATIFAGDLLVAAVANKYPTNGPSTPTDAFGGTWVALTNGQASGGVGVDGTDLGHVYTTVYYKVATGAETGNLTITVGSGNSSAARVFVVRGSTGIWSIAGAQVAVDLSATAWSAAFPTDPGLTTNDIVFVVSGGYTDAASFTSEALAQTGITFSAISENSDAAVTDGDDMRYVFVSGTVTAGTSSDASLVYTMTGSGLTGGSSVFVRVREAAATIARVTNGAVASGTSSLSVAYPTGLVAGNILTLCVANKYPTNGPSTPAGWTAVSNGQASGGADPDGADTGHVYSTWFTKVSDGTETGNLTVTITSGNAAQGIIFQYSNSTGLWLSAATNGGMNTVSASWSVAGAADEGVLSGDMVSTCSGTANDASLFTETTEVLTQTGVVYGLSIERQDNGSSNGDDVGLKIVDFHAVSGTSSAAPTFATTVTSANGSGSTAFLRLRQDVSATPVSSNNGFLGAIIQ